MCSYVLAYSRLYCGSRVVGPGDGRGPRTPSPLDDIIVLHQSLLWVYSRWGVPVTALDATRVAVLRTLHTLVSLSSGGIFDGARPGVVHQVGK